MLSRIALILIAAATVLVFTAQRDRAEAHGDIVRYDCSPVLHGGDGMDYGITFDVNAPFVAIEMRFFGGHNEPGTYAFTAQLFRGGDFTGPIETQTRLSLELPKYNDGFPDATVGHIDLGRIPVSGTETFSLRFVDVTGPGVPFYGVGIGNSCDEVTMWNEQTGSVLTDRGNEPFLHIVDAVGQLATWGDNNCSNSGTAIDALVVLDAAAAEPLGSVPQCVAFESKVDVNGEQRTWGDVNCSTDVNELDAIVILRYLAGVPIDLVTDCPTVPQVVQAAP